METITIKAGAGSAQGARGRFPQTGGITMCDCEVSHYCDRCGEYSDCDGSGACEYCGAIVPAVDALPDLLLDRIDDPAALD